MCLILKITVEWTGSISKVSTAAVEVGTADGVGESVEGRAEARQRPRPAVTARMESGARSFMVGLDRGFGSSGCSRRRAASRGRAAFSSLTAANGARIPEALRNRDAQCGFDGGRDVAPKTKPPGLPAETKFPGDPGASRRRELPMSKKNRTDGVETVRPEVQRSRWRFVR